MTEVVLHADELVVDYGGLKAVDGVSFTLSEGETLGIVGESGCGKSSLGRSLIHMPEPSSGSISYRGTDLAQLSPKELRETRLNLQMVFQDPRSSLHPKRTVAQILQEPLDIWRRGSQRKRDQKVDEAMVAVGLEPALHRHRRPAELSGGQCQRVAIARALVTGAKVLICDEPISSLDVSLRATILNLLEDLKREFGLTLVFIAHDLAVVRNISDRVIVMYLGKIVEEAAAADLFSNPAHPYTQALIASVPTVDVLAESEKPAIVGEPPSPMDVPSGCRFRTRCPIAQDICAQKEPLLEENEPEHLVACHFA